MVPARTSWRSPARWWSCRSWWPGDCSGERQHNYAEFESPVASGWNWRWRPRAIGVWEHDLATDELVWDDRVNEIYGKPADGKPRGYDDWAGTIHPADVESARSRISTRAAATKGPITRHYRLVRR